MRELESKRVSTGLGVLLICLFSAVYIFISYRIIDNYLSDTYGSEYESFYVSK